MSRSQRLKGKIAAPGLARGDLRVLPDLHQIVPRTTVADPDVELQRVQDAIEHSKRQIKELLERSRLSEDLERIFDAQLMLLDDPMLAEEVERRVRGETVNGEWALARAAVKFKNMMSDRSDAFFQERLLDLDDIVQRVIANLMQLPEGDPRVRLVTELPPDTILAADDLPPSLMLRLGANVSGIVLERGGLTGHTAVLARGRGIPTLIGVRGLMKLLESRVHGDAPLVAMVDANAGAFILEPDDAELARLDQRAGAGGSDQVIASPLVLADGLAVTLQANMDRAEDCDAPRAREVSGVGLFRTEFLYMRDPLLLDSLPRQVELYTRILERMEGRPVTFRLLDLGGDKSLGSTGAAGLMGRDTNAAGEELRGLALLLARRPLLEIQLEALLRAAADHSGARLLLPMVRHPGEVERFQEILAGVGSRLRAEGLAVPTLGLGLMIETPGAAMTADILSRGGDFLSIGSNDLTRLTLDAGRGDFDTVDFYAPVVLRLIDQIVRLASVPVSLCGELAGLPGMLPVLIGLGLRDFSMALSALPRHAPGFAELDLARCRELAARALAAENAGAVRDLALESR